MTFADQLRAMAACQDAIEWVDNNQYTLEEAWAQCDRGDWMLWYAQEIGVPNRPLTLAKARCAQLVEHLMGDKRSKRAVQVAIAYGHGEATQEELQQAAAAAAVVDAATYAASAAAAAAFGAAAAAVFAADAATTAATAATDREKTQQVCADICREELTEYIIQEEI